MRTVPSRQISEVSSSTLAGWRTEERRFQGASLVVYLYPMYKSTWNLDLNAMLYTPVYHHQSFSTVALLSLPLPFPSIPFLCYHCCWCRWLFPSNYSRADRSLIPLWPPSPTSSIPHSVLYSPFILHSFSNLHWIVWMIWIMPFLHRNVNPAFTIETINQHKKFGPFLSEIKVELQHQVSS